MSVAVKACMANRVAIIGMILGLGVVLAACEPAPADYEGTSTDNVKTSKKKAKESASPDDDEDEEDDDAAKPSTKPAKETPKPPAAEVSCGTKANLGECFDCCEALSPGGFDIRGNAVTACENGGGTQDECQAEGDTVCAKDPKCVAAMGCANKNTCTKKPLAANTCAKQTSNGACFDCCDLVSPGGIAVRGNAVFACLERGGAEAACQAEADATCAKDPSCKAAIACVVEAKCREKL